MAAANGPHSELPQISLHPGGVLAVGTYDGNISVYDVKSRNSDPVITSDGSSGKHLDPVWKVKWIDTGNLASTLVSISTDGRVTRWKISKGLEYNDLMKLKRTVRRDSVCTTQKMSNVARNLKHEAFISRLAAGTAFDFSQQDDRIYIAGAFFCMLCHVTTQKCKQHLDGCWHIPSCIDMHSSYNYY
jgi:dynein intermediate chain 4, axonemal